MRHTILILITSTVIFSCVKRNKDKDFVLLAEKLIEINDSSKLADFEEKLRQFNKNPESVFVGNEYYYDTKNNKFQAYRGDLKELIDNAQWFLLIDNLQFGHYLLELDWKTNYKELMWVLNTLANQKNYVLPEIQPENEIIGDSLDEVFPQINKTLAKENLVLINLYIDSDSYVTGLIKKEHLNEIVLIAKKLGNKIEEYK